MSQTTSLNASQLTNYINSADSISAQAAITNSTNQTLSGATATTVVLGTTSIAPSGPGLTIGANAINVLNAGVYNVSFNLQLTPTAAGSHSVSLLNGTTILDTLSITVATLSVPYNYSLSKLYTLTANSVLTLTATQPSGAAVISGTSPTRAQLNVAAQI